MAYILKRKFISKKLFLKLRRYKKNSEERDILYSYMERLLQVQTTLQSQYNLS